MNFCPDCDTRLTPRQVQLDDDLLTAEACDNCGYYKKITDINSTRIEASKDDNSIVEITDSGDEGPTLPTTQANCPKCDGSEAFWWLLQTRGGDEATTQFYRCTECKHTWRVYA